MGSANQRSLQPEALSVPRHTDSWPWGCNCFDRMFHPESALDYSSRPAHPEAPCHLCPQWSRKKSSPWESMYSYILREPHLST